MRALTHRARLQRFWRQVNDSLDLIDVTRLIAAQHLGNATLALPTANFMHVVIARRATLERAADCAPLEQHITSALDALRSRAPAPYHLVQQLAAALALMCGTVPSEKAAEGLRTALTVVSRGTIVADDHEVSTAFGAMAQIVCAIAALPLGSAAVDGLRTRGVLPTPMRACEVGAMLQSHCRRLTLS